jgi:anti-sigma regulatory factor (Ser/Thr protein kinase)
VVNGTAEVPEHRPVLDVRTSSAPAGPEFVDAPFPPPPDDAATIAFGSDLRALRTHARAWATEHGAAARLSDDLVLAVDELAANSLRHGGGHGRLRLWADHGAVVAEVTDQGWIRDRSVGRALPRIDQTHGRGLWIVGAVAGHLRIHSTPDGTAVRAHFGLR